ncbi:MAG: hypothetical protein WCO25_05315 [Candidatus Uhrbacteria bacterium]
MAIYLDALPYEAGWDYRIWDAQTGQYVSDASEAAETLMELKALMEWGGIRDSPDANAVLGGWLSLARARGTNDLSKKFVSADLRDWRSPLESEARPGPLRYAIRSATLAKQIAQGIQDLQIAEWMSKLSDEAREFLETSFVLQELLRERGVATYRASHDRLGSVQPLVTEIAKAWADAVIVETVDSENKFQTIFSFRLR